MYLFQDCTVLGFVLDHLLHPQGNVGDADCPALSRVFIASIASCNHSPEAQLTLVSEVKSALQRALNLPESSDKHSRVQALTGIISTMIESCPTQGQIPNQVFKGQQNIMNNIVRNLLKRGLVTDLARIPYSLDLSSPYMAATINAALRPLETLTRSVNMNSQNVSTKQKNKSLVESVDVPDVNTTTPNTQGTYFYLLLSFSLFVRLHCVYSINLTLLQGFSSNLTEMVTSTRYCAGQRSDSYIKVKGISGNMIAFKNLVSQTQYSNKTKIKK